MASITFSVTFANDDEYDDNLPVLPDVEESLLEVAFDRSCTVTVTDITPDEERYHADA